MPGPWASLELQRPRRVSPGAAGRQGVGGAAPRRSPWEPCGKQPVLRFRLSPHGHANSILLANYSDGGGQHRTWHPVPRAPRTSLPLTPEHSPHFRIRRELQLPRPTAWENTACRQDPIYVQVVMCVHRTNLSLYGRISDYFYSLLGFP